MKNRFISLALCILMVLTVLATAACGNEGEGENLISTDPEESNAKTITIWGIKGEGTTDEAVAAVEEEMSKITKRQFNTAIELNLYFEDEYKEALEARFAEIEAVKEAKKAAEAARKEAEREAKKKGETLPPEETLEEDTTEPLLDELGRPITVYPEVAEDQLDIFLITDYDTLCEYNDEGLLKALDGELSGSAKLIKSYIHPTLISAGKLGGKTVALINQTICGEGTYMLVNRELLEKYYFHIDNISDNTILNHSVLENAVDFIFDVKREEPEYTPVVGDLSPLGVNYFTMNGEKSIFGHMVVADAEIGHAFEPRHMLWENPLFLNYIKMYMKLRNSGCIGSETFTPEDKFGVGVLKGNLADVLPYEENYHIVTLQAPQGTTDNLYDSMFAVSNYTADLERSMEILSYLNTKSDLRNLFGYGIEGEHYKIDKNGLIDIISDEYNMTLEYTGNCFIAYPPEGESADYWEIAKKNNIELVLSPFFGFELTEDMVDMELYEWALGFSERFYADLEAATTEDEVLRVLDLWAERSDDSDKANLWVNMDPEVDEDSKEDPPVTLGVAYKTWFKANRG